MRAAARSGAAPAVSRLALQARRRRPAAKPVAAVARRPLVWPQQPVQQRRVAAGATPREPEDGKHDRVEQPSVEGPPGVQRSAGAQVAGGGVADEPPQAAAAPHAGAPARGQQTIVIVGVSSEDDLRKILEAQLEPVKTQLTARGKQVTALGKQVTALGKQVTALGKQVTARGSQVTALGKQVTARGKQVTAIADATGAIAESLARAATALSNLDGYWPHLVMIDAGDLVEWMASGGCPADVDAVLEEVLVGHRGYLKLRQLLLHRVTAEVPEMRSLADQFGQRGGSGWWREELLRLAEMEVFLRQQAEAPVQQQPEDEGGDARSWWPPFVSTLQAYCSRAAAAEEGGDLPGGGDGLRSFLLAPRRDACAPLVMLVAALAAGQLRTCIEFDGAPRLAVGGSVVTAETMAICSIMKGVPQARQQLLVAAQVMVWLLHVAAPDLLHDRQLQLRGVLAVQELSASQRWEAAREVEVTSCGVTATMGVEVWRF